MLYTAKLEFTGNELQVLYTALDELPGKVGRPLFVKIQQQVQRQIDEETAREKADEPNT